MVQSMLVGMQAESPVAEAAVVEPWPSGGAALTIAGNWNGREPVADRCIPGRAVWKDSYFLFTIVLLCIIIIMYYHYYEYLIL